MKGPQASPSNKGQHVRASAMESATKKTHLTGNKSQPSSEVSANQANGCSVSAHGDKAGAYGGSDREGPSRQNSATSNDSAATDTGKENAPTEAHAASRHENSLDKRAEVAPVKPSSTPSRTLTSERRVLAELCWSEIQQRSAFETSNGHIQNDGSTTSGSGDGRPALPRRSTTTMDQESRTIGQHSPVPRRRRSTRLALQASAQRTTATLQQRPPPRMHSLR